MRHAFVLSFSALFFNVSMSSLTGRKIGIMKIISPKIKDIIPQRIYSPVVIASKNKLIANIDNIVLEI